VKIKFYLKASGKSPVEEFLKSCSDSIKSDFMDALLLLEAGENLSLPLSRNLSSFHHGLHELRLKDNNGIIRVFYFIKKGDAIYIVHGFRKKTQALPQKEIELVLRRIKEI